MVNLGGSPAVATCGLYSTGCLQILMLVPRLVTNYGRGAVR
jgi:hypothetical protein